MANPRRKIAAAQRNRPFAQLFLAHPQDIGETYGEHAGHALAIGLRMVGAGFACLVHALIPGLFVRTASNTVDSIVARMASRESPQPGQRASNKLRLALPEGTSARGQ